MKSTASYYTYLLIAIAVYFAASKVLFDKVNTTTPIVIDELFHLPQGKAYCEQNYTYWDKKITTLPGLYLISNAIGLFFECNTYNLRFVNLIASTINLILLSSILKFIYCSDNENQLKIVMQAVNLALLPPLYFFSHIYYTDTLSLTFLLAFSRCSLVNRNRILTLILGLCSVVMRQTNVIWVAMVFGHKMLDLLIKTSRVFGNKYISNTSLSKHSIIAKDIDKSKVRRYYGLYDVFVAFQYHISTCFVTFFQFLTIHDWSFIVTHVFILGSFLAFVLWNGSIVVGDKQAHVATLHVPQMLYFLIFYGIFGLPYVVAKSISTLKIMFHNKFKVILFLAMFAAVVHFNTIVHPYLLADNRHYTFYIWNRWFGKYDFAVYATVPVYVFLLYSLYSNLCDQNCVSFLLPYVLCTFLALSLQKMIEVRYFLVPYIILRLRFVRPSFKIVVSELLMYLILNHLTFYLFFTKQIMWKDFGYAQRIIW